MNAIALGPLLISLPRLYAIGCALVVLLAARYLLRLPPATLQRWFTGLVIVWLIGARIAHITLNLESYSATPWDALKLWQPGYHGIGGLLAGLLWSAFALRRHLIALLGSTALLLGASGVWLILMTVSPLGGASDISRIPELSLENLEGEEVYLPALTEGSDRVVVNLWATWCPPCRREMPLLEEMAEHEGVTVAVVNQGEDLLPIVRYLDAEALSFTYALRDPNQQLMALFEAPGLPTTVLFDGQGNTLDIHVGELTRAHLERWLED
ncbi:TlpA disulfide reductase family protein [Vreelandella populi]|uniref:TlpA family protein disulfide reductase n=1 Tax=Vreelandella populi TaxID=2498858 RepID=A0A433L941_9GAMM|nr:TlpA disulfide reductase family protein [Halomonas populi]RUR41346.1 TlpA family protein disulfide reductase [Halomonas populi]RUR44249.1 TlpA family protein disulfide reductase [Halomonas populi]